MHIAMETELYLLTAFRNSAAHQKDVHWLHHRWNMGEHRSMQCH